MSGPGLYRRTGPTSAVQIPLVFGGATAGGSTGGSTGGGTGGTGGTGGGTSTYDTSAWSWSDTNRPWSVSDPSVLTAELPAGAVVVDAQNNAGLSDWQNLTNTLDAAGQRVFVRLQPRAYVMTSFRMIGTSGDPTYAFGFFHPNLRGFISAAGVAGGASFEMAPNSMSQAQLDALKTKAAGASGNPNQMGLIRIDGNAASPFGLIGVAFRSADQQPLTAVDTTLNQYGVVVPQPAPFTGITFFSTAASGPVGKVAYCLAEGAAHAMSSLPPFEHANFTSQYGTGIVYKNTESDGRLAAKFDAARPRRCGVVMLNNEGLAQHVDCWLHHTNVSRYAVNDQNKATSGTYELTRTRVDHISDTHNVDPAQNGGVTLGGVTNASCVGFETCNGTINLVDPILEQYNSATSPDISHHISLTPVGTGRNNGNPQGGRLNVYGGTFRNYGFPSVDGFLCVRAIGSTYWKTDGYDTTMHVYRPDGTRLTAYEVTSWPPTAASLASAGVTPTSHFLVRNS